MYRFKKQLSLIMAACLTMVIFTIPATAATTRADPDSASRSYGYKVTTASVAYRELDNDMLVFISPETTCLVSKDKVTYKPNIRADTTYKIHEVWRAIYVEDLAEYSNSRKVLVPTNYYPSSLREGNRIKINYKLVAVKYTNTPLPRDDGNGYIYDKDDDVYIDMR